MLDVGYEFMPDVTVVNDVLALDEITKYGLQCDPVGNKVFQDPLQPGLPPLDNVLELRLRKSLIATCSDEDLSTDAAMAQFFGDGFGQLLAAPDAP